ncbi:hypothetical protein DAI22_04g037833 [Oryza sativa Japonica Group]|nr:hypothetical protein DAI22_04g037833 [Oryza sativa Japonica Group]
MVSSTVTLEKTTTIRSDDVKIFSPEGRKCGEGGAAIATWRHPRRWPTTPASNPANGI